MYNRRELLHLGVSATAASVLLPVEGRAVDDDEQSLRIVDTNVSLFHWPFRRLPLDEVTALVAKLRALDITKAWAGSFEGLLHRDLASVNQRLADTCRQHPQLVPIGSVNLQLPDWEDDLRRCFDEHQMPGVRLHPNYHGYTLTDPRFCELLKRATGAGRFVQLAAVMEDTRTQHPLVRVADVDLTPLPDCMSRVPGVRLQILNCRPTPAQLSALAGTPGLYFDTARLEGTDGVPELVKRLPPGRVLFGTHAPFLIPEAALIRVHESGQLDLGSLAAVLWGNARKFLGDLPA